MEKSRESTLLSHFVALRPLARKLLLCFGSVCAIVVLFLLPPYREWISDRIITYYKDFATQKDKMSVEKRMADRFEGSYTYSKQIAAFFSKKKNKTTALVLMPPTDYFKQYGIDYHVPEPAVFYYYTGLKTMWPNSRGATKANWYVHVNKGEIVADSITDRQSFTDTLAALNKFDISL